MFSQLVLSGIVISQISTVSSIQFLNPKAAWQRCVCTCNADSEHGLNSLPYVNTNITSPDSCDCHGTVGSPFQKLTDYKISDEQLDKYCKGCTCVYQTRNVGTIAFSMTVYMTLLVGLVIYRLTSCTVPEDKLGPAKFRRSKLGSRNLATNSLELEKLMPDERQMRRDSVCSNDDECYQQYDNTITTYRVVLQKFHENRQNGIKTRLDLVEPESFAETWSFWDSFGSKNEQELAQARQSALKYDILEKPPCMSTIITLSQAHINL